MFTLKLDVTTSNTRKVEGILTSATSDMNKIKDYQKRLLQKYSSVHSTLDSVEIDSQQNIIVHEVPTYSECSIPSSASMTENYSSKPCIQLYTLSNIESIDLAFIEAEFQDSD